MKLDGFWSCVLGRSFCEKSKTNVRFYRKVCPSPSDALSLEIWSELD